MAHNRLRAFSEETGQPVEIGDNVVSWRGTRGILASIDRPRGPGHSGKVTVRVSETLLTQQNYDSVWGLRVEPEQADEPIIKVDGD